MFWRRGLAAAERARFTEIERGVAAIEKQSDAEIVPVLVTESHDYAFYEFRLAIIAGLLTFLATLIWLRPLEAFLQKRFWDYDVAHLVFVSGGLAFGVMLLVYVLVNIPLLDRLVIPRRVMAERVHERALRAFTESKVSFAPGRLGLLLFVSMLEQRVELLAGRGLGERVDPQIWQAVVKSMSTVMKQKGPVEGILHGLGQIAPVLIEKVPSSGTRESQLPDQVTMMER